MTVQDVVASTLPHSVYLKVDICCSMIHRDCSLMFPCWRKWLRLEVPCGQLWRSTAAKLTQRAQPTSQPSWRAWHKPQVDYALLYSFFMPPRHYLALVFLWQPCIICMNCAFNMLNHAAGLLHCMCQDELLLYAPCEYTQDHGTLLQVLTVSLRQQRRHMLPRPGQT